MHDARILASRYMRLIVDAARETAGASICRSRAQPILQRGSSLFRDLELNRPTGLVLDDGRPGSHMAADGDIVNPKADEIAAKQLAVDSEVEQRQVPFAVLDLKSDANGLDLFRPKRALLADERALVPRHARSAPFV